MAPRFFNSLTRTVEDFVPLEEGKVRMYGCGPTVYGYTHIGNLRAFLFFDLLRRYLRYRGYQVRFVMNITDVDDKIIRGVREAGKSLKEYTNYFTEAFQQDCRTLGIEPPDVQPHATDEIEGMVALIERLLEKGHAYRTENGDIYFRIATFEGYGKLANLSQQQLKANADGRLSNADEYDKESVNDFALWKAYRPEDGEVFWDTRIGKGRPGWHIECSAMSAHHLELPIDIHCGGIDLLFPHHTNEIAQSEAGYGGTFVRYWMHNGHLMVNGKKMSKSLGNFFTLRDLLDKGYDPQSIRLELIKTHYRQQADFREDNLASNLQTVRRFQEMFTSLGDAPYGMGSDEAKRVAAELERAFTEAMDDDLNVARAFAALHQAVTEVNKLRPQFNEEDCRAVRAVFEQIDTVVGLFTPREEAQLPQEVAQLIKEREAARAAKDWARSDELRAEIGKLGYDVLDTPQGTKWSKRAG